MKNVTKLYEATLKALRTEMQAVLDKFGANLEFEVGNMRFSDAEVDIKVKAKVKGAKTQTDSHLELMAKMLGITKLTNQRGDRLVEFKSRSPKYPFVFERAGKRYKCSEEQAKMLFAA